jgi:integrase
MTEQAIRPARRPRRRVLTDRMVAALPRRPRPYFFPDPELVKHGIRIRPKGPGAFTVICRDRYGRQRWIKVGSTDALAIAEARDRARQVIRRVEAGLEPFPPPKPKPESVAAIATAWLHRHVEKNKHRTADEQRRIVERYILPHWRDRIFIDIRRKDVAHLLDYVEDEHGPAMADAVLATMRSIATWVQQRDDNYSPPFVRGMRRTPKQERKRSRVLSDDELRKVWQAAGEAGTYGAVVKLLLLTAQRREKILSMRWPEIDRNGVWTIRTAPREKGNPGRLQLPKQALAVLKDTPCFAGDDHVFSNGSGRRGFHLSWLKSNFDQVCGVDGWRLHDLRRTARSLMSRAGVPTEHAERVLGHARPAIEDTYDLHPYDNEKAAALAKLANLIERIVNPPADNVVTLQHEAVS